MWKVEMCFTCELVCAMRCKPFAIVLPSGTLKGPLNQMEMDREAGNYAMLWSVYSHP